MTKIKVSIIVAIYNVENYLLRCLESLANQTLKDIEIILVDDGSFDASSEIAKEFAYKKANFKYFKKKNEGLSSTRNFGISKSAGDYIGFVDGDDYTDYEMFEKLYNCAFINKSEIVICEYWRVFENKKLFTKNLCNASYYNSNVLKNPKILNSRSYAWNKIYHRRLFLELNNIFPHGQIFEDSFTVYNLMLDAKKVSIVPEGLYFYDRTRSNSITNSINENIFDMFKSFDSILKKYKKYIISNKDIKKQIYLIILRHLLTRYKKIHSRGFSFIGIKFIIFSFFYLDKNLEDWKLFIKNNSFNLKPIYRKIYWNKYFNPIYLMLNKKSQKIIRKLYYLFVEN